ncbi:MAG: formylglycine-generating enzyme family protein [Kiritimatiellae bacterium]|nr:formylglycine-generating enzyme family protein [Kiritimatiellia bacterium]
MKRNKTGWMAALAAAVALWAGMAWGAVGVTNVTVQQRYPWNGLVDIDYEVVCDDADADVYVMPTGYDRDLNMAVPMVKLSGDGAVGPVKPGKHRMTWDMGNDRRDFHSSDFAVQMRAFTGTQQYLVVDMSGGKTGTWTVSGLDAVPEGGWTDEYKTKKMVLRLIMPGTFTMGSPVDELGRDGGEVQHEVTLTRPYFIGVFEVTGGQYYYVTSSGSSDKTPRHISYNEIRGGGSGANWPASGAVDAGNFLGIMREKTGLSFDLPTEAQWEYACRAGTTTALNSGKNITATDACPNVAEVGRYYYNGGSNYGASANVGSYPPNAWGLYDMHGNVWEWCLDWSGNYVTEETTDPVGAASGSQRILRGGGAYSKAPDCRSARRISASSNSNCRNNYDYFGFRLCCPAGI